MSIMRGKPNEKKEKKKSFLEHFNFQIHFASEIPSHSLKGGKQI